MEADLIRHELAAIAARLIADGGLDYASAKRKAARQAFGSGSPPRDATPDNDLIDQALREHLALFDPGHRDRVALRRRMACEWLERLAQFTPLVTGAVWKGLVTEHAPIHLQLFHDSHKEIEIDLLNRGIAFEIATVGHYRRNDVEVEALGFIWEETPILLSLYDPVDLRGALRAGPGGAERGDRAALLARMKEEDSTP